MVAALLSAASVVPLLTGLSLAGNIYDWSDWRTILLVVVGGVCLLLFVARELHPALPCMRARDLDQSTQPLLGLRYLRGSQILDVCIGAVMLGMLVSTAFPPFDLT